MGFKRVGYDPETMEDQYQLVCDECGAVAHNPREEFPHAFRGPIEWLMEKATKYGWTTRRAAKRSDPRQWVCLECLDKMKASSSFWEEKTPKVARA